MPLFNIDFAPTAGRNGRVVLNNVVLAMGSHSCNVNASDLPIYNFETTAPGLDYGVVGRIGCDISFQGAWNLLASLHKAPVNCNAGAVTGPLLLYLRKNTNFFWSFDEIRILSGGMQTELDGFVNYSVSAKSNGAFVYPDQERTSASAPVL